MMRNCVLLAFIFFRTLSFGSELSYNLSFDSSNVPIEKKCQNSLEAFVHPKTSYGLFAEVDFLYWMPNVDDLSYAFSQNSPMFTTGDRNNFDVASITKDGTYNGVDFSWKPGVALKVGFNLPFDQWKFYLRGVRFTEKATGSTSIDSLGGQTIAALWLGAHFLSNGYLRVLKASGHWNLNYYTLDGAISRSFLFGSKFVLTANVGLRGGWVKQRFRADYEGGDVTLPAFFKGKNDFVAVGIFPELDVQYYVVKSLSLVGKFLVSMNFGKETLRQQALSQIQGSSVYHPRDLLRYTTPRIRLCYESAFGLNWSFFTSNRQTTQMQFSALYHLIEWVNVVQFKQFIYSDYPSINLFFQKNGTLGFQGVSVTGGIDF